MSACGGASDSKASTDNLPAVVSVLDATVTEGAASAATALTLTNPDGVLCRVAYATRDLSAHAPDDYEAVQSTIMQISGVANTALPLKIVDNNLVEPNKTFSVLIALAAGSDPRCQLGKSVATITIVNDDQPSVVSIADATINETTGGQALISMTNPAGRTCAVTVTSTNGTAVAPADFTALSGVGLKLAGVGSLPVNVTTVNDVAIEPPETLTLTIALAPGSDQQCQLGRATATVTIVSDDVAAVISIADATVTEGAAGQTTISMTNVTGVTCRLTVTTADGTAVAPGDYTAINGASVVMAGVTSTPLNFNVVDDVLVEPNETFTINIALAAGSDPRCQIGRAQATITIVSNDAYSVVTIGDVTVAEGATAQVPVTMTNAAGVACALTVTTANGTAVAPGDYTAMNAAPFTVNAVASTAIPVATVNDVLVEASEAFKVSIALAANADPRCQIGVGQATVTITDNDQYAVVSVGSITVSEAVGTAQVPVTMTNATGVTCNLTATLADGTATFGLDYAAPSNASFSITGPNANFGVPIINDTLIEPNETFTVSLALAAGSDPRCQIGASQATVTIVSDDVPAVISVGSITVSEAVGTAQVPVTMTNATGVTCNLTATLVDGTATSGLDYAAPSNASFSITGPNANFGVPIINDALIEPNETFTVSLALAAGSDSRCQIGAGQATVTIVSDDAAAVISIGNLTVGEAVGTAQVPVTMTNSTGVTCNLTATTANGTATAGQDYTALSATPLTIAGPSANVGVTIINDALIEPNETFTVSLALAAGSDSRCQIGDGQATVTIVSDDVAAVISIADATVTEGGASNQTTISMTNFVTGLVCPLTVTTADGVAPATPATAGFDYIAKHAEAFSLDAASKPLALAIVNDGIFFPEPAETFTVTIALATGADARCQIGRAQAVITIAANP
ncbi:MAG: Calx-beta domain-containing protein [Burkholderiaceae bacterium]